MLLTQKIVLLTFYELKLEFLNPICACDWKQAVLSFQSTHCPSVRCQTLMQQVNLWTLEYVHESDTLSREAVREASWSPLGFRCVFMPSMTTHADQWIITCLQLRIVPVRPPSIGSDKKSEMRRGSLLSSAISFNK